MGITFSYFTLDAAFFVAIEKQIKNKQKKSN